MLTLMLVGALCTVDGCAYIDATQKFGIKSDAECVQIANYANDQNRLERKDQRFACLEPSVYRNLVSREL